MNLRTLTRRPALWLAALLLLVAAAAGGLRWWQHLKEQVPPGATLIERAGGTGVAYLRPAEAD